ncbi:tape measure protein [Chitinophaga sp. GCM10012297]|uniref:Tape measure protein n=1 Tax=Chitinophaga chungangae TaxID=2821488 RepID=A0ABS3YCU8_9BACT|nr:tape measure protein [Chitinophaga chungangae]MBO9151929.1 tape measure protein [Chitinophaga chungangae]
MARRDLIDEVINSPKVDAQLDRLDERLEKVVKKIIEINRLGKTIDFSKGFTESARAAQEARAATEALRKEREELRKQEQATRNAIAETRLEQQKLKTEMDRTREAEQKARIAKKALKDSIVAETGSILQLRNTLRQLQAQYDALGPKARNAIGGREMLANIRKVDAELKKLEATTGRFQRNVGNYPKLVGGLQGFLGGAGIGVTLGAAGIGLIAKQVFDTTVQLDSMNAALRAVSGSEEEFAKNQQFLLDVSERLGLNILELTGAYKLFYAASTQSGLSAGETRTIFESVAESAAVLKLSAQDTQGVLLAFSQVLGKGKVQAEELRGQIGERIPGAFAIAARSIGVTEQQLNKMLEKGEVIASDFLPKFAAELRKTYGTDGPVDSLQGSINKLSNEFTELVQNNESGLSRFFKGIVNASREALNGFNIFLEKVQEFSLGEYLSDLTIGRDVLAQANRQTEELINQAKRDELRAGNNAYIEEFKKASAEQRKVMLEEAKKMAAITAKAAEEASVPGFLTGANPTQLGENAEAIAKARRAQDYAFQESDRVQQFQQILAEEAAAATKATANVTKEQENAAARLRERQRKALLDAKGIDLQAAIDSQKEIFENEKVSLQGRLDALGTYYELRDQLITENLAIEKQKEGLLPEEIALLEKKADAERLENRKEFWKEYTGVAKSAADEQTKAVLEAFDRESAEIDRREAAELERETERYQKKQYSQEQFELIKLQIANKYNTLRLQAEIAAAKKSLEILQANGQPVEAALKRLHDLEMQLAKESQEFHEQSEKNKTEATQSELEKRRDLEQQYHDRISSLRQDALQFATDLGLSFFEKEKNRLQDQIDLISEQEKKEIEAITRSAASTEEKENQITVIKETAQVKREALERRQREIDARAAQFQKFASLFQIGITTAETLFKIQAQAAVLSSNPLTAALASLAYAQIPIVIASGALQAAAIAAKRIPRYAEGTDDHPGGWAMLGDAWRHELVVNPDGTMQITPNRPTYMDLMPHAKVLPDAKEYFLRNPHMMFPAPPDVGGQSVSDPFLAEEIVRGVDRSMRRVEKAIMNRPSERTIIDADGIRRQAYDGHAWQTYVNQFVHHR